MIKKLAYSAMMSYHVSDEEKDQAMKAIRWFDFCTTQLDKCDEHLNLLYNPFKKNSEVSPDDIFKVRSVLRIYRDKVVENFNYFKRISFKCYAIMQAFTSDTQIDKQLKAFVDAIEDIEIQVNRFVDLFNNLKMDDFAKTIVTAIENIKKEIAQLEEIINERIKSYIKDHILARNWVDSVSEELQKKIEKKSPLTLQLVEERAKMMGNS